MIKRNQIRKKIGRQFKHRGRQLVKTQTIKKLNISIRRLKTPQLIKGNVNKILYPLVTHTRTNPVPKKRKMNFRDIKVDKLCVIRLYVNKIKNKSHPFFGKTKGWLKTVVQKQLSGMQVALGIDFDVNCWDEIQKQTFLISDSDVMEVGHKVRMLILFDDQVSAVMAYAALHQCMCAQLPWRVYRSGLKPDKIYVATDINSIIAYWLCSLEPGELKKVTLFIQYTKIKFHVFLKI